VRLPGLCPATALVLHLLRAPAIAVAQTDIGPAEIAPGEIAPGESRPSLISGKTAAVAGLMLGVALVADQGIRNQIQEYRGTTSNAMARLGNSFGEPRYVLPALGAGFLVGQLTGSESLTRVALRAGGAVAIAGGISTAAKFTVGRGRPEGDDDADLFKPLSGWSSFPSGHTAVAFAVATVIADETRDPWADAALYGAATLTAIARLNDDRHWTSDVLVGALVGHISARWVAQRGGFRIQPAGVTMSLDF
jgi:membrane-associated phospholipid phosphatase